MCCNLYIEKWEHELGSQSYGGNIETSSWGMLEALLADQIQTVTRHLTQCGELPAYLKSPSKMKGCWWGNELTMCKPSQVLAKGVERGRALEGLGAAVEVEVSRVAVEVVVAVGAGGVVA